MGAKAPKRLQSAKTGNTFALLNEFLSWKKAKILWGMLKCITR